MSEQNALGKYLLGSLGFVVIGLVEFACVIVMNRTSSGTKENTMSSKIQQLKMGNLGQKPRTLSQVLSIRYAMKQESYKIKDINTNEDQTKSEKEGRKFMGSLYVVDIISCGLFLFLFLCFNFVYFTYYLGSSKFSCDMI